MALPSRFVPLTHPASGGGTSGPDWSSYLAPAGTLARLGGKLGGDDFGTAGTGLAGLFSLARGVVKGDPGQAVGGAANVGSSLAGLTGFPGVSNVLGAIGGPLTFATGLAKGDPLSSIIGGLQTGSLASGYLGGPTISSGLSGLYSLLPGAEAGAGAAGAGAGAAGIGSAGWALNPAAGMGGMLLMGGLMGKAADAEASGRAFTESQAALKSIGEQMRQANRLGDQAFTAPELPGTLSLLHDTLQNAPNLGLFTHTGRTDISGEEGERTSAAIQRMRAGAGQDWLRGLDAAQAQGIDLTGEGGALRSPWRVGDKATLDPNTGLNQDMSVNTRQLAHLLDLTEPEAQSISGFLGDGASWSGLLESAASGANPTLTKAFGPDRLALLKERLGFDPSVSGGALDPNKVNTLMDDQWLTSTVHDAVHDVGLAKGMTSEQLAQAGIAPGAWQTLAGGNVYGGGVNADSIQVGGGPLPSLDTLAAFPGAGTGLAGLLTQAHGILGDDWLGGGLDAPVPGRHTDSWSDLDWTGMPSPRKPWEPPGPSAGVWDVGGGF